MRPQVEEFPGGVVVGLGGELDAYHAETLREILGALAEGSSNLVLVLDLSAVSFLDSTALGVMIGALRRLRESNGELRFVLPETPARRIFELTALDRALDVRASRAEAIAG